MLGGERHDISYVINRYTAWFCIILTFIAGVAFGFALLAVILTWNL